MKVQRSAMYRLMATLSGDETREGVAQLAWMTYLDHVCSNCGASRVEGQWDEMWGTCAPCGRKLDYGSEQAGLPPECRDSEQEQRETYEYLSKTDRERAAALCCPCDWDAPCSEHDRRDETC